MKKFALASTTLALLSLVPLSFAAGGTIPSGAQIVVRADNAIEASGAAATTYPATVAEDVLDDAGKIAVPRGSRAALAVRQASKDELILDLASVTVNGRRHVITAEGNERSRKSGLGANKRTGTYVGGGAAVGSIIGAIAGGGKGAAIGALTGAAAGAGTQVLTRGKSVKVPAETKLTFKLDQPVQIREARARAR